MQENFTLDRSSGIPLYIQLKQWLNGAINDGTYPKGTKIPTENELCDHFHVSRGTVRQATRDLINEGKLYLVRGSGTFVADHPKDRWLLSEFVSIAEALMKQGIEFETRVLEISKHKPTPRVATELQIEAEEEVIHIFRVRSLQGVPMILMKSYIPARIAPGLLDVDLTNRSLYTVLEEKFDVHITGVDHTISVRLVTEEESEHLGIPVNSPVHDFEEHTYDATGIVVDYSYSVFRGDQSRFYFHSARIR